MIKDLFKTLDKLALKSAQRDDWILHSGDIVINKKKYREIKREFKGEKK